MSGKNGKKRNRSGVAVAGTAGAAGRADGAGPDGADGADVVTEVAEPAGPDDTAEPAETDGEAVAAEGEDRPASVRLLVGAGITGLEGVAVAAWGVGTCLSGGSNAVLAGLFVLLLAALPLAAAYGLRHARRWSRGPALIMQLLALPIGWTMLKGDGVFVPTGAVLLALAVTGLVVLAHPATTDALGISRS